jgi:hypothetical protein
VGAGAARRNPPASVGEPERRSSDCCEGLFWSGLDGHVSCRGGSTASGGICVSARVPAGWFHVERLETSVSGKEAWTMTWGFASADRSIIASGSLPRTPVTRPYGQDDHGEANEALRSLARRPRWSREIGLFGGTAPGSPRSREIDLFGGTAPGSRTSPRLEARPRTTGCSIWRSSECPLSHRAGSRHVELFGAMRVGLTGTGNPALFGVWSPPPHETGNPELFGASSPPPHGILDSSDEWTPSGLETDLFGGTEPLPTGHQDARPSGRGRVVAGAGRTGCTSRASAGGGR